MSIGQIQYRNPATLRFGCNDVFGILIVVAAFDVDDDDGMVVQLDLAMIMSSHSNPNIWNPSIALIVAYDLDSLPLIDVQMHAIDVKSGNSEICPVCEAVPMRTLLQNLTDVNALNRPR